MKKLFIVRKYVEASSAKQAIKLEKKCPIDDVYVDEDWKKNNTPIPQKQIRFKNK